MLGLRYYFYTALRHADRSGGYAIVTLRGDNEALDGIVECRSRVDLSGNAPALRSLRHYSRAALSRLGASESPRERDDDDNNESGLFPSAVISRAVALLLITAAASDENLQTRRFTLVRSAWSTLGKFRKPRKR